MLYIVGATFESVNENVKFDQCVTNKATEQYFPMVLSIMLYIVGVTFQSVKENVKCDHSNESY